MVDIKRIRKLPVEVTSLEWTGDNFDQMAKFTGGSFRVNGDQSQVFDKLHDTWVTVSTGQSVIKGVEGEFYPIAPTVLWKTYEEVP